MSPSECCFLIPPHLPSIIHHTTDKTIKLWKIGQRRKYTTRAVSSYENTGRLRLPSRASSSTDSEGSQVDCKGESKDADEGPTPLHATSKRVFSNAHAYHINSLATNSDGQTFVSADDLRINWWDLEVSDTCFSKYR
jgi:serine/threonine-protein phosphatase 2A regulatory subunit B